MMKLTLNQNELEQAITDYVAKQGLDLSGIVPEINIVAGRGANGTTAEVDLENKVKVAEKPAVASPTQVFTRSTAAAPKQEQKPEVVKEEAKAPVVEKEPDMSREDEDAALTTEAVNLFEAKADAEETDQEEAAEQVDSTQSLFGAR